MKKKSNVWLPVCIVLGVLIALFLVLTAVVAVKEWLPAGKAGSAEEENTADTEDMQIGEAEEITYLSDVDLGSFAAASTDVKPQEENEVLENDQDYILPNSQTTALTDADLAELTAQELTYARNEIYARHGRIFESQELNTYFQGKSWYTANPDFDDSEISEMEAANAGFISEYQNSHNLTYTPQ